MRRLINFTALCGALSVTAPAFANTWQVAQYKTDQQKNAAAGLLTLRQLNLLTLSKTGTNTLSSEVEGKAYFAGNLSGGSVTIGAGGNANKIGKTTSYQTYSKSDSVATLTVGGNVSNGVHAQDGLGTGKVAVNVGGNESGVLFNLNNSGSTGTLKTGGTMTNYTASTKVTAQYGVSGPTAPGVSKDATLKAGGTSDLAKAIGAQTDIYATQMTDLSDYLKTLTTSTATFDHSNLNNMSFKSTAAMSGLDYGIVNVAIDNNATLNWFKSGSISLPDFASSIDTNKTLIINVVGSATTIDFGANFINNPAYANQNVIWNFANATTLNLDPAFYGSILAPKATINGSSQINGSVVSALFNDCGEVHLGTYNGTAQFIPVSYITVSVPEPATWAMMLTGFGAVGGTIRRQRRQQRLAAA